MHYHDPARPRLANNLPAWLTATQVALPRCIVLPLPNGKFQLEWMINGSYKTIVTFHPELVLDQWVESPEAFALQSWGTVASTQQTLQAVHFGGAASNQSIEVSPEALGL